MEILAIVKTQITGLEAWAEPVLYLAAAASALACWLTTMRFNASNHGGFPATKILTIALLIIATGVAMGISFLSATLMAPLESHLKTGLLLWALACLPSVIACARHKTE